MNILLTFIHIPFAGNIADFELFRRQIFEAIACIRNGGSKL